jgi:hypothetical protein
MDKAARFRLHRSRAFWFGVPGLLFLLWAWVDSVKMKSSWWSGRHWSAHLAQYENYLQLQLSRTRTSVSSKKWVWGAERTPRATANSWPRCKYRPRWTHIDDPDSATDVLLLPHWFVVLLYLLPWSGVVAWRWWQRRRMTAAELPLDCGDDSPLSSAG